MWRYPVLFLIFTAFFLLIPGIGAFFVRSQWRKFRLRITGSSMLPRVRYQRGVQEVEGFAGVFRFFGSLEAIQGNNTIWISGGSFSLSAELAGVMVYLLPSFSYSENEGVVERNEENIPDEIPQRIPWNRIFSLPEGTKMFLSGALFFHHGQRVFRSTRQHPLTVVIYDGEQDTILRRSIWAGRQRNEYWNRFTAISLIAGSLALLILAYNSLRLGTTGIPAFFAIGLSMTPILPFLPIGLPFFLLYRNLWKRARFNRAERDILKLPTRYFGYKAPASNMSALMPDGGRYSLEVFTSREHALAGMSKPKIRTASVMRHAQEDSRLYYVFAPEDTGGGQVDPMAENLMIPGNPLEISLNCERKARRFEVLAGLSFLLCYLPNLISALILLNLWIR
ncbi:MAG: hypothetical protein HN368_21520 [Spirochaetales bacterium]|nr:hypothetical protein [Spirochaetales bacterium]